MYKLFKYRISLITSHILMYKLFKNRISLITSHILMYKLFKNSLFRSIFLDVYLLK